MTRLEILWTINFHPPPSVTLNMFQMLVIFEVCKSEWFSRNGIRDKTLYLLKVFSKILVAAYKAA